MSRSNFQIQTFPSLGWRGNGAIYRLNTGEIKKGEGSMQLLQSSLLVSDTRGKQKLTQDSSLFVIQVIH